MEIPEGKCQCGCGGDTALARQTRKERNQVAGKPVAFIRGHNRQKATPGTQRCSGCKQNLPPEEFSGPKMFRCRGCNNEYVKAQYAKNPDLFKKRVKAWREANPEKAKQIARAKEQKKPELYRELARKSTMNYRGRRRAQFVENIEPLIVLEIADGVCGICGEDVDPLNFHIDHIIPISGGGEHSYSNVQPAHPHCNWSKGASLG